MSRHALVGSNTYFEINRKWQLVFLKAMGLQPQHYLLDLGSGTLRGGLPIIEYLDSGHYFGIEIRREIWQEGEQEYLESGLDKQPTILCGSIPDVMLRAKFDYIWAYALLMHLDDEILGRTFSFVHEHLVTSGVFYASANIGPTRHNTWREFPNDDQPLKYYKARCADNALSCEDIGCAKDHGYITGAARHDNQRILKIAKCT